MAITELTGRHVTIYAQQEVVKDMIAALLERGGTVRFEVADVRPSTVSTPSDPRITYTSDGADQELECDFVAGCDGFHGCLPALDPRQAS